MTTDSQPLIDCRNVRKMFPDPAGVPFPAVDGVSFRLSAGEIVGLLGPDGAGKTTLIRLITGLMKPHEGSISVLNLDSVKRRGPFRPPSGTCLRNSAFTRTLP